MVGIHASGISIPLFLLMLLGWRRIWIASLTRPVCQCGSLSTHLTSFQLGPCNYCVMCTFMSPLQVCPCVCAHLVATPLEAAIKITASRHSLPESITCVDRVQNREPKTSDFKQKSIAEEPRWQILYAGIVVRWMQRKESRISLTVFDGKSTPVEGSIFPNGGAHLLVNVIPGGAHYLGNVLRGEHISEGSTFPATPVFQRIWTPLELDPPVHIR